MNATLTRHALDLALFPEMAREPGQYFIAPVILRPGGDKRIAAPEGSQAVLLVGYALLLAQVPKGSVWQLVAVGPGADGKERRLTWQLARPAPRRDNMERATPSPGLKPDPGAVDRGVFWLDLGPLMGDKLGLRPGDLLTVQMGPAQASVQLLLR